MPVGEHVLRYGADCYVPAGATAPVSGQVVRASEAESYYGIRVDLDPKAVHLSLAVLHRRFKAVTIMSPLQYQKHVRRLEARKLQMSGGVEAANVAFQLGYESPSQSRRRDLSPQNNIIAEHLRDQVGLCYSSPPLRQRPKNVNVIKWLRWQGRQRNLRRSETRG